MRARYGIHAAEVLLVEDNPGDARLTREALGGDAQGKINVHHVIDGVEALQYLRREGKYTDAMRPDMLLLDLNMPRKNGREVLQEMKSDPELCDIPVLVLTNSDAERDVHESYDLRANCFIHKPVDFDCFLEIMDAVRSFWFGLNRLPH